MPNLNFRGKNVLVTGGTGMIGRQLVPLLMELGAYVRIASVDSATLAYEGTEFVFADLTDFSNCLLVCKDMDIVFHLAGIKGSPKMTAEKPASFFVPTIMFNTNMMEAARKCNVER
ncbi:MAG TPA: NAD(P)-dependent oxidoreductase, partial [Nitrospirae bacterium]|nr:NAD(P)-dependent oxidoreductase [Nitrospirota bacterium]